MSSPTRTAEISVEERRALRTAVTMFTSGVRMTDLYPPRHYTYDNGRRGVELPAIGLRVEEAPSEAVVTVTQSHGDTVRLRAQDVEALLDLFLDYLTNLKDPA